LQRFCWGSAPVGNGSVSAFNPLQRRRQQALGGFERIVGSVMIAALQRDRSDPDRQLAYPFFAIRIEFIKRTLNIFKNSCCGSASEMPIYVSNLQIGPLPKYRNQ
jgi:hypothetical protein